MLDINVSGRERGITVIEVRGRVDSTNAEQLGATLSQEIEAGRMQLVLDLSAVDYMSSAGLREIVAALKRTKRGPGGDVRIAQPSYRVREVLEMAGLDTVLQIYPSQVDAVGSY